MLPQILYKLGRHEISSYRVRTVEVPTYPSLVECHKAQEQIIASVQDSKYPNTLQQ